MINGETKICGIIGDPVKHSFSPLLHNTGYEKLDLNYVYLPFEVKKEDLSSVLKVFKSINIKGLSVTMPHKINIIPLLDDIDTNAQIVGAVNTVVNINNKFIGYNTDGYGAFAAIEEVCKPNLKKIGILGTGGAAKSIAYSFKDNPLYIFNRTLENAKILANTLNCNYDTLDNFGEYDIDIVINATPVGMSRLANQSPINPDYIKPNMVVMDTIYYPHKTLLIKKGVEKGCKIVYGYRMLLHQAIKQFELFTGVKAPFDVMDTKITDIIL